MYITLIINAHVYIVTLRNLSNIATNFKYKKGISTNDLQSVLSQFQKDPSVTVEVFTDTDQNLMGIFYQDETMKHKFTSDATLCISHL